MSPETDNKPSAFSAASATEAEPDYRAETPEETTQPDSESAPLEVSNTTPATAEGEAPAESVSADAEAPAAEGGEHSADDASLEGMSEVMDQMAAQEEAAKESEFVEGTVVAINDLGVVVDFGAKSEGLIPALEFSESEGAVTLLPGQ